MDEANEVNAEPKPESCPEPVWDGPYKMTCGHRLVDGECVRHGKVDVPRAD